MRWRLYCASSVRDAPATAYVTEQCSSVLRWRAFSRKSTSLSILLSLSSRSKSSCGAMALWQVRPAVQIVRRKSGVLLIILISIVQNLL